MAKATVEITAASFPELEDKKQLIAAICKLDANSITKLKTMANSPKVSDVLQKKWNVIKMFL